VVVIDGLIMLESRCTFKSRLSHYLRATLQPRNSPTDWARELFKPSKMQQVF